MEQARKDIIRFALDYNILDIATYWGYRGDLLVKFTMPESEKESLSRIREEALGMGMEVVIKDNKSKLIYELYCITPSEDTYELKL
jgi:hypothetical protein